MERKNINEQIVRLAAELINELAKANDMNLENINKTLAHELAHAYLHYDKGNIVENKNSNYEEQADRAAFMLLDTIQIIES